MRAALKRRAYRFAALLVARDMDNVDLPADDLSEEEETQMREFIRVNISDQLYAKGREPKERRRK